jgi:predicted DsbA family dithiol-disulfide isomerase
VPVGPATATPCTDFADAVCDAAGDSATPCDAVWAALDLLPDAACRAALAEMPEIAARIRQARASCVEIEDRLCADLGAESTACLLVREQTPNLAPERCRTMLESYDEVLRQLVCMERTALPVEPDLWRRAAAPGPTSDGPADAAVVVVVFSDFQCPYCAMAARAMETARARFEGASVRWVFRHYPLDFHPFARPAAEASLAAAAQGRFWAFHDRVFAERDRLGPEMLADVAAAVGLDTEAWREAVRSGGHAGIIDADRALGNEMCITGTPTLFIDGVHAEVDIRDEDDLGDAVARALAAIGLPVPADAAEPGPDAP